MAASDHAPLLRKYSKDWCWALASAGAVAAAMGSTLLRLHDSSSPVQ